MVGVQMPSLGVRLTVANAQVPLEVVFADSFE